MNTKREAIEEGEKVRKSLGKGWKVHVWENLGWHFSVDNRLLSVHESCGQYSCMMTDDLDNPGCGSVIWRMNDNGLSKDPRVCVRKQVKFAQKKVAELQKIVEEAKKIIDL